jgi:murein L,D-transpeptidase YcbB/YkuD
LLLLAASALVPAWAQSPLQAPVQGQAEVVATPTDEEREAALRSALSETLNSLQPARTVPRSEAQATVAQALYRENGGRLLWYGGGRPGAAAYIIHSMLAAASLHGLRAEDYRAAWLGERIAILRDARPAPRPADAAQADVTLTLALLRYLADVRRGRSPVRQISGSWAPAGAYPDSAAVLEASRDQARLQRMLDEAPPAYPAYRRLLKARTAYEALVAARKDAPRFAFAGKITPGNSSPLLAVIASRLVDLGDLRANAGKAVRYEGELVAAVERFQSRHGLAVDGVIGKSTVEALQVPNWRRLRQIDLAMERLRWLPPLTADRVIGVNIPDFRLRAYAGEAGTIGPMRQVLESRVVVGKQGRTPTPVFIASLNQVDFNPYWNVPISIARGEILPRLRRDPGYLERQRMEFVAADGRTVSREVSAANLAAVATGTMRIRQRPHDQNALGDVKFTMPNSMNIYLHDTPSRTLFAQSRRDFSHGCIRVEKPVALARYALADDPLWDDESIRLAMADDELRVVRLRKPIPVVVFYTTVTVEEDGTLRFLPDIYGHDAKLDAFMPEAS